MFLQHDLVKCQVQLAKSCRMHPPIWAEAIRRASSSAAQRPPLHHLQAGSAARVLHASSAISQALLCSWNGEFRLLRSRPECRPPQPSLRSSAAERSLVVASPCGRKRPWLSPAHRPAADRRPLRRTRFIPRRRLPPMAAGDHTPLGARTARSPHHTLAECSAGLSSCNPCFSAAEPQEAPCAVQPSPAALPSGSAAPQPFTHWLVLDFEASGKQGKHNITVDTYSLKLCRAWFASATTSNSAVSIHIHAVDMRRAAAALLAPRSHRAADCGG